MELSSSPAWVGVINKYIIFEIYSPLYFLNSNNKY
jgi:hypothetical protein